MRDRTGALGVPETAATLIVYIVDDDESVRKGLSRLIRSAGFEPRVFASAEEFLNIVRNEGTACVLLDITMPRMDGLQVQARLTEKGITLPVIAVSARDDEETRHMARELGARFFLRKPVDDQALLDAVDWVTHGGGAEYRRERQPSPP
jgi:FixJ family two-component response regulator